MIVVLVRTLEKYSRAKIKQNKSDEMCMDWSFLFILLA
jgi:hypothetical protein